MSFKINDSDDLEIDDISQVSNKKKKIKSGSKGKRGELDIVNELNLRFVDIIKANPKLGAFSRSIGSGNRFGQKVKLSANSANTFAGDITCPDKFKFVLECKNGYNDIDLCNCYGTSCRELDAFLEQVTGDCARPEIAGRKPMLIWKKDRKQKIAFLKKEDIQYDTAPVVLLYKGWVGLNLNFVLQNPDSFFFNI